MDFIEMDGALSFDHDHGVIGARAVVVPAVNRDCEQRRQLHAQQFQIVHNQAGRQSGNRLDPRFNGQRGEWGVIGVG